MPKMTEEHKAFLSAKSEGQLEHVAGCEQCFNYFLFGEGYRCKEYPAKHRIKDADFMALLNSIHGPDGSDFEEHNRVVMAELVRRLVERFGDEELTEETLHEVTIVPDDEWTKSDIVSEVARKTGLPVVDVKLEGE